MPDDQSREQDIDRAQRMRVLVVSSEADVRESLRQFFARRPAEVCEVDETARGLKLVRRRPLDVVVVGGDVLRTGDARPVAEIHAFDEQVAVIAVVNVPDLGRAALAAGAYDFFLQPVDFDRFDVVLRHVAETQAHAWNDLLAQATEGPVRLGDLVTRNARMLRTFAAARRLARYEDPVLIAGETGTGKESLARAMHALGRSAAPFVVVNAAAATPEELAHASTRAAGGTLFIDDVLALGPETAAALVTGLDERARSGDDHGARLVAACRAKAERRCSQGTAQEDLYLRLAETTLGLPPLRERVADILPIATELLQRLASGGARTLGGEVGEALLAYDWPGNVEELQAVLATAVASAAGAPIALHDLPPPLQRSEPRPLTRPEGESRRLADIEAAHLRQALAETRGNKARAARILGLSRWALQRKLQKHRISTEEPRS